VIGPVVASALSIPYVVAEAWEFRVNLFTIKTADAIIFAAFTIPPEEIKQ